MQLAWLSTRGWWGLLELDPCPPDLPLFARQAATGYECPAMFAPTAIQPCQMIPTGIEILDIAAKHAIFNVVTVRGGLLSVPQTSKEKLWCMSRGNVRQEQRVRFAFR